MVLAIDIGGTYIRVGEVKKDKIYKKRKFNTPNERKKIIELICKIILDKKNVKEVGISVAGTVRKNFCIRTPNLDLNNTDIAGIIKRHCKTKVYLENDAKCAALAEKYFGEAKNIKNAIIIVIGTGIGGAIITNGKIIRGEGNAGEIGHMYLPEGEFEKVSSGKAILNKARELGIPVQTGEDLRNLAYLGDPRAISLYEEMGKNVGLALLNLSYILDPEKIIIGGGFTAKEIIVHQASKIVENYDIFRRKIKIVCSKLGEEGSLIGAGIIASGIKNY